MSLHDSALHEHISNQQTQALRLCGLLEAIATLDNQSLAPDAVSALIQIAVDMAEELNRNLDSVALPKD